MTDKTREAPAYEIPAALLALCREAGGMAGWRSGNPVRYEKDGLTTLLLTRRNADGTERALRIEVKELKPTTNGKPRLDDGAEKAGEHAED